jgi:UDP-N-acetylmuramate dehydrogenase
MFSRGFLERNRVAEVPLSTLTTMRVGGPATVVVLDRREDLGELLAVPHRWLGKGANLVVGDAGVEQAVARLGQAFATLRLSERAGGGACVQVGAGCDLAELIAACQRGGLAGPEGLAGVPATVGGALRMNAGTSSCWMLDWVSRVEVVLPGEGAPRWLERASLPATYRSCGLPAGTLFLGAELELAGGDRDALRATAGRLKRAKAASQPLSLPSAGCVFKNPSPELPAGRLIDELGLKNERVGGASVSPVHANFIVNAERSARAADIFALITRIRVRAWRTRGVRLDLEVETWNAPGELQAHPRDLVEAAV